MGGEAGDEEGEKEGEGDADEMGEQVVLVEEVDPEVGINEGGELGEEEEPEADVDAVDIA